MRQGLARFGGGGAAALAVGALLRAVFVWRRAEFAGDALVYGDIARNLLVHHLYGLSGPMLRPTLIRLPGYPLFLTACFLVFGVGNYLAVLWVQVAVDLASCALLGVLAARLFGWRAGLAVLWLAALCPFTANYTAAALTETDSLFCVVLAFFALERWIFAWRRGGRGLRWAGVVGLALVGAVLLRPEQGLLAAAVVPVMLWVGWREGTGGGFRRMGPATLASAIVVLPLLLWGVRNWRVFHVVQPLAPRSATDPGEFVSYGFNRWYRTWGIDFKSTVDVYWTYDGSPLAMADLPPRAFDDEAQRAQTEQLYAAYNPVQAATPGFDAAFAQLATERVARHPVRYYVALPVAREANMWLRPRTELMTLPLDWWAVRAHPRESLAAIAFAVLNAVYLVLAGVGLWRWWKLGLGAMGWGMVGFVVLRCALLATLDNSEPRYTLECFPVVILLAGLAVARPDRIS